MRGCLGYAAAGLGLLLATPALSHPHIFAEARLEIVAADDGTVKELRNVWRFDDVFSSSVLMDFDKNSDLKLDHKELQEIAHTIRESLGDYSYFTFISKDGASSEVAKPDVFNVDYKDNQLLVFFIAKPKTPLKIGGRMNFGVYDPTLYTAIDFAKDSDIVVEGKAFAGCKHTVVRPDPDQVIAQNQSNLTEAFFNDPAGTDMGKLFATRLELTC
ncbi:DUF1007 family protein [Rhizobium glycinendophyticum]|uniref:DUF1007 family protein n=1 Tax=Rhizobium glycinendophyticum TaxID=2589807 RepID=A0A504U7S8_9HYPH|nr:DUF1007 family protein [Rhizobium glycinendophyticum]TPP06535.1 DUF1007 family protein [Rhizobium glycinendophyticum]